MNLRDRAVIGTVYAGPATLLRAYQQLLKLAGKKTETAFPEGIWQFYVDYALRDDTARHTCETHGFDTFLQTQQVPLTECDRLTAWVMTAVTCLHQYPHLLKNEWRERVYTHTLWQITQNPDHAALYRQWETSRPYAADRSAHQDDNFPAYREHVFDQFLETVLQPLPEQQQQAWQTAVSTSQAAGLAAYQQQMSILAYLEPDSYGELRKAIPLEQAWVGLIYHGHYYLLPVCAAGSQDPVDVALIRSQIAAIAAHSPTEENNTILQGLSTVKRYALPSLRRKFSPLLQQKLALLRQAPIWINADRRPHDLPLAAIRQAERGIGDHPLTIFMTDQTAVFDLSHIFFDGTWGAALAEILTNEAINWAAALGSLPEVVPEDKRPFPFILLWQPADKQAIDQAPHVAVEVTAENSAINLAAIRELRQRFKHYPILQQLTVNDIMLLYRAIHAIAYRPAADIVARLHKEQQSPETSTAAATALNAIQTVYTSNPAILIPVDASRRTPRDRVTPMTFEVPLQNLDIVNRHQQTLAALANYERAARNRTIAYDQFDKLQRTYLGTLAGLGEVLSRAKERARKGDSFSMYNIKLLAYLPTTMQRLLDNIPNHFDGINDAIKGREVFSNVGVVAPSSSLTRFITAKDDNEKKELAWAVLTDAQETMYLSLRDFRPHVAQLTAVNRQSLATEITTDLLNSYANGLNQFVQDLLRITAAAQTSSPTPADSGKAVEPMPIPVFSRSGYHRYGCWMPAVLVLVTAVLGLALWIFAFRNQAPGGLSPTGVTQAAIVTEAAAEGSRWQAATPTLKQPAPTITPVPRPTETPITVTAPATTVTPIPTAPPTPTPSPTAVYVEIRAQDKMPMVLIPATTFMMGAAPEDAEAEPDERPYHPVTLNSFYIDRYEVSVVQYVAYLNEMGGYMNLCAGFSCLITKAETNDSHVIGIINGSFVAESGFANYPINNVSWHGAVSYCEWVGARLPTEAEWELAARGEDGRIYPWGSTPPDATRAVFSTYEFSDLRPVAALPGGVNQFGLFNMAGSVWEWVFDGYDTFYYEYSPAENPTGPVTDNFTPRILRGGSYTSSAADIRASNRVRFSATSFLNNVDIGFRCARSLQEEE